MWRVHPKPYVLNQKNTVFGAFELHISQAYESNPSCRLKPCIEAFVLSSCLTPKVIAAWGFVICLVFIPKP